MSFSKERIKSQTATSAVVPPEPPAVTTPWKQANLTAPPQGCNVPPGWGSRWVRADGRQGDDRIAAKSDEGWQLWDKNNQPWNPSSAKDPRANKGAAGDAHVDGTDISSAAKRRNLVFMVLSPERKAARERFLWEQNNAKMQSLKDPKAEEHREAGK